MYIYICILFLRLIRINPGFYGKPLEMPVLWVVIRNAGSTGSYQNKHVRRERRPSANIYSRKMTSKIENMSFSDVNTISPSTNSIMGHPHHRECGPVRPAQVRELNVTLRFFRKTLAPLIRGGVSSLARQGPNSNEGLNTFNIRHFKLYFVSNPKY